MSFLKLLFDLKKIFLELLHFGTFLKKHKKLAHRIYIAAATLGFCSCLCLLLFHKGIYHYLVSIRPSENLISNTLNQCGRGSMITWIKVNDKPTEQKSMFFKSAQSCEADCEEKKDCVKNAIEVNEALYALERPLDSFTVDFFKKNQEITWLIIDGKILTISGLELQESVPYIVRQLLSITQKDVEFLKIYSTTNQLGQLTDIFTFSFWIGAERKCSPSYADSVLRALVSDSKNNL